jgi:hypothetical protein
MATEHILSLLIAERDKLNNAIAALGGTTTPIGRPSKSSEAHAPAVQAEAVRTRRPLTPAQKKRHSDRMKAYWAARRKKAGRA